MMMNTKRLPYDAEVEWIKSTAGAYVDTGIKASGNLRFRTILYNFFTETNLGGWCFGAADGYLNRAFGILINKNDNYVRFRYSDKDYKLQEYSAYPQSAIVEIGNGIIQIGGIRNSYPIETFTSNYSFTLFKFNNAGNLYGRDGIGIGDTYITDGVTTLDLIPVRKNGKGYMYDRLSDRLLATGDFIAGPDK